MSFTLDSDLASAHYSTAAATFMAQWGGGTATFGGASDGVYFDGDFSTERPFGHHIIEFPFAHEGDAQTEIIRQRFWQSATSFQSTALGSQAPGRSDWLLLDEENFKDEGANVISWDRVYATLPKARDVFENHSYGFQYFLSNAGTLTLTEQAFQVASRVRVTYCNISQLGSQIILLATKIMELGPGLYVKRGAGNLSLSGSFIVSSDDQIVAEDTTFKLWRYPFVEFRTRWINGPTTAFWGESISL